MGECSMLGGVIWHSARQKSTSNRLTHNWSETAAERRNFATNRWGVGFGGFLIFGGFIVIGGKLDISSSAVIMEDLKENILCFCYPMYVWVLSIGEVRSGGNRSESG